MLSEQIASFFFFKDIVNPVNDLYARTAVVIWAFPNSQLFLLLHRRMIGINTPIPFTQFLIDHVFLYKLPALQ